MARSQLQDLFKASLESQEEVATPVVGGIESMEAAMLSVEEAKHEMDAADGDVDEMVEIAEGLESIMVSVEASQEDGGLDAQAAQMMQHAVGAYTSRLGLEASEVTPSLEAFGGDSGRQTATSVSLESLAQTARNIWNALKTAIERAIKATADFFAKIFGGVEKVQARIDALKKSVQDAKGSASGEMTLPNAAALHVGGKTTMGDIDKGMKVLGDVTKDLYVGYMGKAAEYYEDLAAKFKASDVQGADSEAKVDAAIAEVDKAANEAAKAAAKIASREFSGGRVVEGVEEGSIPNVTVKTKAPTGTIKINVPSKGELSSLLQACEDITKVIKDAKSKQQEFSDARKEAVKEAEGFVKAAEGNRLGKVWNQAKANVMLRKAQRDLSRPVSQITSHSFGSVRAALGLVESALKEYKEEAAS